jgi:hypothetical protein
VVGGHLQELGVNYDEVYAAVTRYQTVRFLLAFATVKDWEVRQLDYKTDSDICMAAPPGLNLADFKVETDEGNFYGLKQAPRLWKNKVDKMMRSLRYKKSVADAAVYYKQDCIVAMYVDDAMAVARTDKIAAIVAQKLLAVYEGKNLGDLNHIMA